MARPLRPGTGRGPSELSRLRRRDEAHSSPNGSQSLFTSAATKRAMAGSRWGSGNRPRNRLGPRLPKRFLLACRKQGIVPGRFVLVVSVLKQVMSLLELRTMRQGSPHRSAGVSPACFSSDGWKGVACQLAGETPALLHRVSAGERVPSRYRREKEPGFIAFPIYDLRQRYRISTSRYGTGSRAGSNQTPLGLHRVAEKIGGGQPLGTVFRSRQIIGFTWQGHPGAPIVHRILWLEGLEPGCNRGGEVDTHARYVYIHGTGDETTLGRPASRGCIHVSGEDLLPLFDLIPSGTLVWIGP
jgi:L,D-transpeptidase YbiS